MELLKSLYKINSKSGKEAAIKAFVQGYLAHMDVDIRADESGNLFITKGVAESYPCVVAHLDEVHDVEERQVVVEGDMIYATDKAGNRVGLGADDKNGVWMALRLLEQKPLLKVALFVDEEKLNGEAGCRGSRACDLSEFDNATCLLQCIRGFDGLQGTEIPHRKGKRKRKALVQMWGLGVCLSGQTHGNI